MTGRWPIRVVYGGGRWRLGRRRSPTKVTGMGKHVMGTRSAPFLFWGMPQLTGDSYSARGQ